MEFSMTNKMPNNMMAKLIIFDTTLRDGEQSPGAAMTREMKIRVARQLEKLGVDIIEAGFAAASPGDFEAVKAVAEIVKDSTVCSLARAGENDVRRAGEAIKPAKSGRIHTFIATSPIHMQHKLRMSEDQVVERAVNAVKWALEYTDDVEFSAEDAVRSDMDFLVRVFDAVIKAGAKTLNVPACGLASHLRLRLAPHGPPDWFVGPDGRAQALSRARHQRRHPAHRRNERLAN